MRPRNILGIIVLIVGIILLVVGISSTHQVNEKVVQAVSGEYTDKTMWYIIGGIVLIVLSGIIGVCKKGRR